MTSAGEPLVPRNSHKIATLCVLAAAGSSCALPTSSVMAKHRSVAKTAKQSVTPTDRTPADKKDCIAVARTLYGTRKLYLSKRNRLSHKNLRALDRRISQKITSWGFYSRNKSYFCAIDPQSESCLQSQ